MSTGLTLILAIALVLLVFAVLPRMRAWNERRHHREQRRRREAAAEVYRDVVRSDRERV